MSGTGISAVTAKEKRGKLYIAVFAALFIAVFFLSMTVGRYPLSPLEVVQIIFGRLFGLRQVRAGDAELIVFTIRMPRVLAGAMIGAGLSAAGAAYQGLFRNPMVSPDVLGASAGAGFGAAVSLLAGSGYTLVSASAFMGGIAAVSTAYTISIRTRRNQMLGMVLAGIMISSLFNSGISFIKMVADTNNALPAITFWLLGSLSGIRPGSLMWAAFPILGGMLVLFLFRWKLNILTMGEDEAKSMGVNTKFMRVVIITSATLITAACVAISGLIGWVGLVIPHFARLLTGYDYRVAMPISMLMGASFLMIVDNISRTVATSEVPLGILTAFIGAPFFLYLILNRGNRI